MQREENEAVSRERKSIRRNRCFPDELVVKKRGSADYSACPNFCFKVQIWEKCFIKDHYKYNVIHKIIINGLDKKYFKFTWQIH